MSDTYIPDPYLNVPASPVLFSASVESPEPNEQETERDVNETMAKIRETTFNNSGVVIRSVHAKSHGVVTGTLVVSNNLPPVLAQGLFAAAGIYPVLMRFSTTPGDIMDDSVSTPRGLAVKVIGVKGERVAGSEADLTQDFVLVNGPAFQRHNVAGFLKDLKLLEPTTDKMEGVKKAASAVFRGTEAILEAFGGKSAKIVSLGGQPATHILGETFYSQVPILFGSYIAKIGVFPVGSVAALTGTGLDLDGKPNGIREAVREHFSGQSGTWEIKVQLCTDLATMPVEDASVVWSEDESPYLTVATIQVEPQDSWSAQKINAIDEGLSFSPWHALAAHRPLGSVMRARKRSYIESANFRAKQNGKPISEPRSAEDLPA